MKLKITSLAIVAILGSGCRHAVPIENVDHHVMPERAQTLSYKEIGNTITGALQKRGFYCNQVADNKLKCSRDAHGHQATVEIVYSKHEFSIHHVSTGNMKEEGNMVHPAYNRWVNNMKKDIMAAIAAR